MNLADHPAHQEVLRRLASQLPAVGADAAPPKPRQPAAGKKAKSATPAAGKAPADESRAARFARLYPGKEKLTFDEYAAQQGANKAAARQRFDKMDANHDGTLTRAEFLGESRPQ